MEKQIKAYNKNFILIAIGQIISTFGASLFRFALSLYILDVTRSCRYFCDCLRNLYDSPSAHAFRRSDRRSVQQGTPDGYV